MDKSLKSKAIQIQGKDYVLVSDRIIYFNANYPEGAIYTKLISDPESQNVIVKTTVTPDAKQPTRSFTGYSQAVKGAGFINKTSALENAETSSVGRALAMMGIGVIDSVASADEIHKAHGTDAKLAGQKAKLYAEFGKAGIKDFGAQKAFVGRVLGRETVESVPEAELVLEALGKEKS